MSDATRSLATRLLSEDPWLRRLSLSKAITLLEGTTPGQVYQSELLLSHLLHHDKKPCFRLGIAGPPGAGKSTFVEALGLHLLNKGVTGSTLANSSKELGREDKEETDKEKESKKKLQESWFPENLAVVCVDPSSDRTGGAILGDKTRMTELSRDVRAFVRPSPIAGGSGALATRTDDVLRLIEATGNYELILIETVGLGQSEIEVKHCVDMLLLLVPPAGGDDLQGVKKGIIEEADIIAISKADGDLLKTARMTAADYKGAMAFNFMFDGKKTQVKLVSSQTGDGLADLWAEISCFRDKIMSEKVYEYSRQQQNHYWMWKNLQLLLEEKVEKDKNMQKRAHDLTEKMDEGSISPRVAARTLIDALSADTEGDNKEESA